MLTVLEAIENRRSIRRYAPDDVPREMIGQMLEAARLAPSGANLQPWRFLVVRDEEIRKELRQICMEQRFIEEAPVVITCFVDLERYSKEATALRRQESIDSGAAAEVTGRFADPKFLAEMEALPAPPRAQQLIGARANTYIAIEHLVLMATALGLGTCWVGAFEPAEINQFFGLADNLIPVAVIPVGYPAGELPPQRPRVSFDEILIKQEGTS